MSKQNAEGREANVPSQLSGKGDGTPSGSKKETTLNVSDPASSAPDSDALVRRLEVFVNHFKFADDTMRGEAMSLLTELRRIDALTPAADSAEKPQIRSAEKPEEPDIVKFDREVNVPWTQRDSRLRYIDALSAYADRMAAERDEAQRDREQMDGLRHAECRRANIAEAALAKVVKGLREPTMEMDNE